MTSLNDVHLERPNGITKNRLQTLIHFQRHVSKYIYSLLKLAWEWQKEAEIGLKSRVSEAEWKRNEELYIEKKKNNNL